MRSGGEPAGRTAYTTFFLLTGVMEVGAGLVLLAAPGLATALIFGSSGTEAALALGRLAGGALLSLGVACWLARRDRISAASSALVSGMLTYNATVIALVLTGSLGPPRLLLWGVAVLHAGMAVWCLLLLSGPRQLHVT